MPDSREPRDGRGGADALLSVVIPFFNESANVQPLFHRLLAVLRASGLRWEIVCINDGSTDGTLSGLLALRDEQPAIRIIDLSRNFGKEAALSAGLLYARGDAVIPMDADLQHPPEIIPAMLERWRQGFEVVVVHRRARDTQTVFGRTASRVFYWVFNRLSDVAIPADAGDFRLLDRVAVDAINSLPERTRFMKGLFAWIGFRTADVQYDHDVRAGGESGFGFWRLMLLALSGLTAFSNLPLRMWSYVGVVVSGLSFLYILYRVIRAAVYGIDVPGYESIIAIMLFLGGLQLLSLGVIAGYVGRVFDEVKNRPLFVVRDLIGFDPPPQ